MATEQARVLNRRDTLANWLLADPVLGLGEMGVELDANGAPSRVKIGDGVNVYSALEYLSAGLLPFATQAEVQAAADASKVLAAADGAEFLLRSPASPGTQSLTGPVKFTGSVEADQLPRAGAAGDKDVVNRLALLSEIAAAKTPSDTGAGVSDAGLAPKLGSTGVLDATFLPSMLSALDFQGGFDCTDANGDAGNGARALENVAGGGIAGGVNGSFVMATATGFWDLGNGTTDPGPAGGGVVAVTASDLLIFSDANNEWVVVATSGIVSATLLKRDGSVTMDGDLAFSSGARKLKFQGSGTIEGESDQNLGALSYMSIDCGGY